MVTIQHAIDDASPAVLDPQTERFLAWAAKAGDRRARETLIDAGRRWVDLHARRLGHFGSRYDDAVAAGSEALIRAVDRFDPARGVRLVTFAWPWIARSMQLERYEDLPMPEPAPEVEIADDLLLALLSEEQAQVISLRFGFGSEHAEPMSRRAVSEALGMSLSRVRRVEAKAISHLKVVLDRVSDRAP